VWERAGSAGLARVIAADATPQAACMVEAVESRPKGVVLVDGEEKAGLSMLRVPLIIGAWP